MQSTISQNHTEALAGMDHGDSRQSDYVEGWAEVAIAFGLFVCKGTADGQVKLPDASGKVTATGLGFAMYLARNPTADGGSTGQYEIGHKMLIKRVGYVWAASEEALAFGDPVYVRITANGGNTVLGKIRNDADSGNCIQLTGARVERASTGTNPALISLGRGPAF